MIAMARLARPAIMVGCTCVQLPVLFGESLANFRPNLERHRTHFFPQRQVFDIVSGEALPDRPAQVVESPVGPDRSLRSYRHETSVAPDSARASDSRDLLHNCSTSVAPL